MNYLRMEEDHSTTSQLFNKTKKSHYSSDRFISTRENKDWMCESQFAEQVSKCAKKQSVYNKNLMSALFENEHSSMDFRKKREFQGNVKGFIKNVYADNVSVSEVDTFRRQIVAIPDRVLDAPDIEDNYYLNLLDWSSWGQLGICLKSKIYLYTPQKIQQLYEQESDVTICSISFHPTQKMCGVGTSDGRVKIFDLEKNVEVLNLQAHQRRVSSLSLSNFIVTGGKDSVLHGYDLRDPNTIARKFVGHTGEICGIKSSTSGLVSGANDNQALVWDLGSGRVRQQLKGHKGAVKGLAWCPWQRNLLATGGGAADQSMKFWNVDTGKCIQSIHTQSQVCSLIWSPKEKQILSSHGYSENQLCLWKYPTLTKIQELRGHTQRVLHMALSPDQSTVCSASADETLRFWKVFPQNTSQELSWKECSFDKYSFTVR